MTDSLHVAAFYRFQRLDPSVVSALRDRLSAFAEKGMTGLVLLATEGINGTVCAAPAVIAEWKTVIDAEFPGTTWNDSETASHPFKKFQVQVRREIVSLDMPEHAARPDTHLTPEQWDAMMGEDVVVLDARNAYETKLGVFENAVDPRIRTFREFAAYARSGAVPKDKTVMMYCTGGIRCEKAAVEMLNAGYPKVYQLSGGILGYLKKFPNAKFKGECFVFDERTSVDQDLKPSARYDVCPHCGDPGDVKIECERCDHAAIVCDACVGEPYKKTCSRNCHGILKRDTERVLARAGKTG